MNTSANSLYGVSYGGISGLVSGMDTESMIDGMTAGTRAKIAKHLQNKQILTWRTDAYRSVSSKLIEFSEKYTSYTSKTNLYSSSFFNQNQITALGDYKDCVSVTGTSTTAENLSVTGIKQMATDARMSLSSASDKMLETGTFDLAGDTQQSIVAGASLSIKYGNKDFTINLDDDKTYNNAQDIANALNDEINANSNLDTLRGKVTFAVSGDALTMSIGATESNTVEITGGTTDFMSAVGFSEGDTLSSTGSTTLTGSAITSSDDLMKLVNTAESLAEKNISFTYNGVTKAITLPDKDALSAMATGDDFALMLKGKLEDAFGTDRFDVNFVEDGSATKGSLQITTTSPSDGADVSSVLAMSWADSGILGKNGIFGVPNGESNRVNVEATIADSGLKGSFHSDGGEYKININDVEVTFKETDTLKDIMEKINQSDAKVQISYATTSDTFTIKSTETGAGGKIKIDDKNGDFAKNLFGNAGDADDLTYGTENLANNNTNTTAKEGQDAKVMVSFNGGQDTMEIIRSSNTFTLDGLNITLNNTFNVDGTEDKPITFSSKVNSDKIVDAVKTMVDDYNSMIELVNKELGTKRNRDYPPLTKEQKEAMSEDQIEKWEEKAKAGMLFNDSDISSLSNELRFVFSSVSSTELSKIGLTTSSNWRENGKVSLDEDKFRAALETRPEDVKKLFTEEKEKDKSTGGVMVRLKETLDRYASTTGATKGILVEKAGSTSAPVSILKNALLTQMKSIDEMVDNLEDKLKMQTTRYTKQFTALEKLMSQMNTQSSWLSQQFGS